MKSLRQVYPFLLLISSVLVNAASPNIVIILADDFGVGDIQAHYPDNKIATPYLDKLSAESKRFTNAHSNTACCTPSRYGLLTGRYSWRTRLQEWVLAAYEPPLIAADRLTLPGFLQKNGYETAIIGKWHLGWNWAGDQPSVMIEERNALKKFEWDYTKPIQDGPITRGFDYYFGTHVPNFPPFTFIENDRVVEQPTERYAHDPNEGVVMPIGFVGSPIAPDWKFDQILPEITRRAVNYIQDHAEDAEPFFLYFSMTSPHEPVVPSKKFAGKSGIAPIADFVMETDWSAGQVVKAIDKAGIADKTIIIFTADNGHSHYTGWEDLINAGHRPSGEYRGHKSDVWEGGHRVPLMVRWPGRVTAGASSNQILSLNDIFATCADLLGKSLPADSAEDSLSFLSLILVKNETPLRAHVVNHSTGGEFAYQEGPWKIVFRNAETTLDKARGKPTTVELYNLENDIAETTDIATEHPEVVQQLTAKLKSVVARGTSRPGPARSNDTQVNVEITQTERWGPAL